MINTNAMQEFARNGAVTIDTPLTPVVLQQAAATLDRLLPPTVGADGRQAARVSATCSYYDTELLDIIQHPFFEAVACQILQANAVRFLQTAIINSYPQPDVSFGFDQHIDLQYRLVDLEAVPRRIVCTFFLWLSEVTTERAPLMYRPGSHRSLAGAWEELTDLHDQMPRVIGIKLDQLPLQEFAAPEPLLAQAGQVTVLTTGMVHGASVNMDSVARQALVLTFHAQGVKVGLPAAQQEAKQIYDEQLRQRLRPERVHLVEA